MLTKKANHLSAAIAKGRRVIRHSECPSGRRPSACNPPRYSRNGAVSREGDHRSVARSALTLRAYCEMVAIFGCSCLWIRIWRAQDIRLWSETPRRQGRPRSGFRIEYSGNRDERRNGRYIVAVRVFWIEEPRRMDKSFRRWISRGLFGFANQQLSAQRPASQAHLSVRRALANLCGLQVRREIEDTYFLIDRVPIHAELNHPWCRYLLSHGESVTRRLRGGAGIPGAHVDRRHLGDLPIPEVGDGFFLMSQA
jgi:hypothetical protein